MRRKYLRLNEESANDIAASFGNYFLPTTKAIHRFIHRSARSFSIGKPVAARLYLSIAIAARRAA
jgi:hypothetical protein